MNDNPSIHAMNDTEKLALLNEVGRLVLSAKDMDGLFRQAVDLLRPRLGLQYVMIGVYDYDANAVIVRATAGIDHTKTVDPGQQDLDTGIIGEVSRTGRTVVVEDVSRDSRYLRIIPAARSEMCIPLKVDDATVGFLNLESDRVGAFGQADVDLLEAVGSFLGQAIRNAALRDELQESKNYLEAVIRNAGDAMFTLDGQGKIRTWNSVAQALLGPPPESVFAGVLRDLADDDGRGSLQAAFKRSLAGETVRGLELSLLPHGSDERRSLDATVAPVIDRRGTVGGVSCILRDITAQTVAEARQAANLAAMKLLNEVSVELTSILDLDVLLERIAGSIRRFIDYEFFAILMVNEETRQFAWKTAVGFSEESYREIGNLGIHEGLVGRAVLTRTPVIAPDVSRENDYRPIRTLSGKDPRSELVLPLIAKDRIIGVLVLGSDRQGFFTPDHLRILSPLAAQIAVSIDTARLYEKTAGDAETRLVMNEVGKEMTALLELDTLLGRVAALIRRVIAYEILGIFLYNPEQELLELRVAVGYAEETVAQWRVLPLGTGLLGHAVRDRRTLVTGEISGDPRAISARTIDGRWTRSEVAVPLISKDRLLGGLVLESCEPAYFTAEHVQILETLASQIAVSLDNARLFREIVEKERRLEADFALARDLQSSMLPISMPAAEGFDFASLYKPAETVGGDYYDFLRLDERRLALAIGDVSGKGVAAAMTMAATRSALRFAARLHSSPSQVLYQVNRRLHKDVKARTFVSLFYGVLDVTSGILRWSNGGHFPPLLLRASGEREELSKGGTLIALFDRSRFDSTRTQLFPGDILCFYTDGVIEARNPTGEEFGAERLEAGLRRRKDQSAREMLKGLSADLRKFTRGAAQHDDTTVFILKACEDS